MADIEALAAVLAYHVVPGELNAAEVLGSPSLSTVNGAEAMLSIDGEGLPRIDDAVITATDFDAKNGVIHIIDKVIFTQRRSAASVQRPERKNRGRRQAPLSSSV